MATRDLAVFPAREMAPRLPDGLPAFLKLIADPNRLRILSVLARGERCVCDVEAAVGLPQNLVSHHLSALKRAGLVRDRRAGKWVYYHVDVPGLRERLGMLTALLDLRQAGELAALCEDDRA